MKYRILLLFLFFGIFAGAQSFHFSQFYSTPLLLNPALTGYIGGTYRVAGNYRSQWSGGGSPYSTSTLSVDFSPLKNKLNDGNRLGIGFSFLNDKTMEGAVLFNTISLSTAYNISLDEDNVHSIGLGFQGMYNERRIDYSKLSFETQLGSGGFDISLPVGETLPNEKKSYFDMSVGAMYHARLEDKSFFGGVSIYNLLKKEDAFLDPVFKLPKRYSASVGGDADVGVNGIFSFSANYQKQGSTHETTIGSSYGIQLNDEKRNVVSFGAWYRLSDALIPYIGYQLGGWQTGLSFDYTISKLKTGGQARNGFELSMVYTAEDKSEIKRLIPWY